MNFYLTLNFISLHFFSEYAHMPVCLFTCGVYMHTHTCLTIHTWCAYAHMPVSLFIRGVHMHTCLSACSLRGGGADINGLLSAFSTVFIEVRALPEPKPNNSAIVASQLAREIPASVTCAVGQHGYSTNLGQFSSGL